MTNSGLDAFFAGFNEARDDFYRTEKEWLARPGAVRLSTLKVGDTFEWCNPGYSVKRYTISKIEKREHYATKLTLQPGNTLYYCSGGITDEVVIRLVED